MKLSPVLSAFLMSHSAVFAADYTWSNLAANGSLGTTQGYILSSGLNWVSGAAPTFDNQAHLQFTGLGAGGTSTTIYGGSTTTIMNRLTVSTGGLLRFNSAISTFSFQGTDPTIDVQSGTMRIEVKLNSGAEGITKTGVGTMFSNLQSVSSGFTGPFTIAQGMVTAGNNYALGNQKTVNIRSGGSANMNGQLWGSSISAGGSIVSRYYTFNIAGTGTNGEGAITNSNNAAVNVLTGLSGIYNLNLDANASVGGVGNYAIGNGGAINGNGYTLTKTGSNQIYISGAASNISYQVNQGTLVGYLSNAAFGGAQGSVSVANGATLASDGARSFANALTFADGGILSNFSGSSIWSGNASLTGGTVTVTGTSSGNAIQMSGVLSGNGGINKTGANTLTLSNANTYKGKTQVSAGALVITATGSISSSSEVAVSSGATFNVSAVNGFTFTKDQVLSGGGTITGNTTISGTHTPGFSPGIQTFTNNLTYNSGAMIVWELIANSNSGRGTNYDGIDVQGNLNFAGPTTITLDFALAGSAVDWSNAYWTTNRLGLNGWKIFDVDGSVSGLENVTLAGWRR